MTVQADNPPVSEIVFAEALTTFFDGKFTDFFVVEVDPGTRELTTLEFYEKRPDLGEIQFLKKVGWDNTVPADAQVFVATSGLLRDQANAFWVGWRTPETLSALSVYQETPLEARLDPEGKLIHPAIIVPSKKMVQYSWVPKRGTWGLYKYEFQGNQGERGGVTRERIGQAGNQPVLSAAAPIPGAEDDRTAVAWIEKSDSGIRVCMALLAGDSLESLRTPEFPLLTPLPHQRLAMHVSNSGVISAGFVGVSVTGGYVAMEVRFDFAKLLFTFHTASLRFELETLFSACLVYSKDQLEKSRYVFALSKQGVLMATKPGSDSVQVLREQVDTNYDYPVLTSATGMYEAARSGGQIEFTNIP